MWKRDDDPPVYDVGQEVNKAEIIMHSESFHRGV